MNILSNLRFSLKLIVKRFFIKKYKTTMFFLHAKKYNNYLNKCKKTFSSLDNQPKHVNAAKKYLKTGACFFQDEVTIKIGKLILNKIKNSNNKLNWNVNKKINKINLTSDVLKSFPELKELLERVVEPIANNIYKCNYKIFFGVMFKSKHFNNEAKGSALWHSDGAPGTCVNVMFYPNGVTKKQGAMQYISWDDSVNLILECDKFIANKYNSSIKKFSKEDVRTSKANFYENGIALNKNINVYQPTSKKGSILFFQNNCLHKGGHPEKNEERLALIFNIYPHENKPDYEDWFQNGKKKSTNYPIEPAF